MVFPAMYTTHIHPVYTMYHVSEWYILQVAIAWNQILNRFIIKIKIIDQLLENIAVSQQYQGSMVLSNWSGIFKTLISLVEIMVLLYHLSYAINTQLKLHKNP